MRVFMWLVKFCAYCINVVHCATKLMALLVFEQRCSRDTSQTRICDTHDFGFIGFFRATRFAANQLASRINQSGDGGPDLRLGRGMERLVSTGAVSS
jgi:hypothetical protein